MRNLEMIEKELQTRGYEYDKTHGATKDSYVITFKTCAITIQENWVAMTSHVRTYESRTYKGALNEIARVYGEYEAPKQVEQPNVKSHDLIKSYLGNNGFEVYVDLFDDLGEDSAYITGFKGGDAVVIGVDANDYSVAICTRDEYENTDYAMEYKHYKTEGKALAYIKRTI